MKLGVAQEVIFCTSRFSTGAAYDATGTPTGTIYKNGTADALAVTVTKIDTGRYKAVFTPSAGAGFADGDNIALSVSATVDSVAAKGVVWQDVCHTDDVATLKTAVDAVPTTAEIVAALKASTGWGTTGSETFQTIIKGLRAMARGKMVANGNNIAVYDDDGSTLLFTLTLAASGRTVA